MTFVTVSEEFSAEFLIKTAGGKPVELVDRDGNFIAYATHRDHPMSLREIQEYIRKEAEESDGPHIVQM